MVNMNPGDGAWQGERFAQARRFAGQARQDRTTGWYIPLAITVVGAGSSFDAFGRGLGFLYGWGLAIAFVALSWSTIRAIPIMIDDLNVARESWPRKITALLNTPVRSRGIFLLAAALPILVALVKTVGFYTFGGLLIVGVVLAVALGVSWFLERR
ncbi:hypothetical protein ACG83_22565 [Frankia sp. R43]|uniref:hypothetical protein n=1 Tax=Frankia sp. R43 TaxID=269536 RepID=UPI0006C9EBF8|nr:hypothetical protein [Frankia sp. R43]KPM53476.1 hypothetical protein ACG83_22565 [Frankia sp. R43]